MKVFTFADPEELHSGTARREPSPHHHHQIVFVGKNVNVTRNPDSILICRDIKFE